MGISSYCHWSLLLSLESPLSKRGSALAVRRRENRLREGTKAGNIYGRQSLLCITDPTPQSEAGEGDKLSGQQMFFERAWSRVMFCISQTRQSHSLAQHHASSKRAAGMPGPRCFALARPLPPHSEGRGLEAPRLLHPPLLCTWCSPGSSTRAQDWG